MKSLLLIRRQLHYDCLEHGLVVLEREQLLLLVFIYIVDFQM